MPLLKFCHSRDIDKILNGSIRFSSLAWFRFLEEGTGDPWIGDRFEGSALTNLDINDPGQITEGERRAASVVGAEISDCTNVSIKVRNISRCDHLLIFSCSAREVASVEDWNANAPVNTQYDACVEIVDLEKLCERIWLTGTVDGRPLQEVFGELECAAVEYASRVADAHDVERALAASPFLKREEYRAQKEYRIVLRPRNAHSRDIAIVNVEQSEGLFREVDRGGPCNASKEVSNGLEAKARAASIRELVARAHAYNTRLSFEHSLVIAEYSRLGGEHRSAQWSSQTDRLRSLDDEFRRRFYAENNWCEIKRLAWSLRLQGFRLKDHSALYDEKAPSLFSLENELRDLARVLSSNPD